MGRIWREIQALQVGGVKSIEDLVGAVTDADFSTLQIVTAPARGTAVPDPVTGRIRYQNNGSTAAADSFTYQVIDDGGATAWWYHVE